MRPRNGDFCVAHPNRPHQVELVGSGTRPASPSLFRNRLKPRLRPFLWPQKRRRRSLAPWTLGHIPGTPLPGPTGNVALAGHRDTFFRRLKDIRTGDEILLTTTERTYAYRVRVSEVVEPRDTWVLAATEDPTLTLVTCYPFSYVGPAPKRFVVQARRAFESSGSARTSGRSTSALPLETVSTTKDQAGPQVRQPVVERLAHLDR